MNTKIQHLKQELNNVFDDNLHTKQWHNVVDWIIIAFIVISTIEVFLTTFEGFSENHKVMLNVIDWATQIFFTIEVSLRIWNADMLDPKYKGFKGRLKYCFSFYGFIDVISTYPFFFSFFMPVPYLVLKSLRVARLLRVFRYMHSFHLLANAFRSKKNELLVSMQFLVIVTLILSFILFFVEHEAQPEAYDNGWYSVFWAFAQYVGDPGGFGEYPPITVAGQVIAFIVGILGIAMFAVPAGLIGSGFTEVMEEEQKEKKIKDNISRIVHSFKFEKNQQHTNLFFVPRYKPLNSIITRKFISENDIIEAVEKSDCLHLHNLAETMDSQDNPVDKIVVINYLKNTLYGCCINRGSKVTIVCTSGYTEPLTSWFAYHIAKIGGFNFVSKEVEPDVDNPTSYYNISKESKCPYLPTFLSDIDKMSSDEDSWVIFILGAIGIQTGVNRRKEDLHFCYATNKHDHTYDDPDIKISDIVRFEEMYQDMSKTMIDSFGWVCDKNEWYAVNPKSNVAHFVKCRNAFTLRVECKLFVFDAKFLATAKNIADVFNRHFEPGITKSIPPEMLKRPEGHDFGMGDYVN